MSWLDLFRRKEKSKKQNVSNEQIQVKPNHETLKLEKQVKDDARLEVAKKQHREGQMEEAYAVYLDILAGAPEHAEALHMVGIVCLQKGELQKSEQYIKKAIANDATKADFYSNLGNVLGAQNLTEEALNNFKKAIDINPQHISALNNAASASLSLNLSSEAKNFCQQILSFVPNDINARLNLSSVYLDERDTFSALNILKEGLNIQPQQADLLIQLANVLELVNKVDEAGEVIKKIDGLGLDDARLSLLAGTVFRRQGQFDKAEQRLKLALTQGLLEKEQIEAFNQLGLTLDSLGKASDAFKAFEQSNNQMSRVVGKQKANGSAFLDEINDLQTFFKADKFDQLSAQFPADNDFSPIFFVGFPRSGTTLMEQVLKAHPKLITTDELSPLSVIIGEIHSSVGSYPQGIELLTEDDIVRFRHMYLQICRENLGELNERLVVDKLPLNIIHLGLAKLLFPEAKIIVALRDPRDACLSCFMQKFDVNVAMANFLNIKDTALTYEAVMNLWLHYRDIFQDSWLEYHYENLTENFTEIVTGVLDFIGVGWHENINDYREAAKKRTITTPSYRDVTAPINNKAIARWRRYNDDLLPILPIISPFVTRFGYEE